MGLFDFLRSDKDKKKEHEAEKAAEQVQQQAAAAPAPPAAMPDKTGIKYTDSAAATKAAAERMAASAPRPPTAAPATPPVARPAPHMPSHTPTPASAAHKAVPAAPKPAPKAQRTYTVRSGDSLSAIARRELGNEGRWRELYAMNKGVIGSNPDMIHPGMKLTLPS